MQYLVHIDVYYAYYYYVGTSMQHPYSDNGKITVSHIFLFPR